MATSITTIDCQYVLPEVAASYLLINNGECAFIDNNTSKSLPLLIKALKDNAVTPKQVKYIIITHVHLDHAGGTSALLGECPNAEVICHPRAARHVINPTRLVASARAVYGDQVFDDMFGTILPIDEKRVVAMADKDSLQLGDTSLKFLHVRGHANHHFVIYDESTKSVFTGDAFGIAYPALQTGSQGFIYPTTSPTDFDPDEALKSLQIIKNTGAQRAYLTHFGAWNDINTGIAQLTQGLEFCKNIYEHIIHTELDTEQSNAYCIARFQEFFDLSVKERGIRIDSENQKLLDLDIKINAMGIAYAGMRQRKKEGK